MRAAGSLQAAAADAVAVDTVQADTTGGLLMSSSVYMPVSPGFLQP